MTTLLVSHQACLGHDTALGHPERPARLQAVLTALSGPEFEALALREAPAATEEELARVHGADYVAALLARMPTDGYVRFDEDTIASPGSREAAIRAAGAVREAVDAVIAGEATNAFCAVRPPGHHAEPNRAMGFCFFNNIAVGALHALTVHRLDRVAVVDFDVHHGNGTQAAFENDARLFFGSTHQMPLYPGTGRAGERGVGNIFNAPLPPGAAGEDFRLVFAERILPELEQFRPDLVMISAGFDAHAADPLAQLHLVASDFAWATEKLVELASRHCAGRIVSTLEGGYDLESLAASAAAHVRVLMSA